MPGHYGGGKKRKKKKERQKEKVNEWPYSQAEKLPPALRAAILKKKKRGKND